MKKTKKKKKENPPNNNNNKKTQEVVWVEGGGGLHGTIIFTILVQWMHTGFEKASNQKYAVF